MAPISNLICLAASLLATTSLAHNHKFHRHHRRQITCPGPAAPPGYNPNILDQWCGMINNEILGLTSTDNADVVAAVVAPTFKQAGITIDPSATAPNVDQILADPQANAALEQMMTQYPETGSPDLDQDSIKCVYADALSAACNKTGVSEDNMAKLIWTESKGHPLVKDSLTQMSDVSWGQMAMKDSSLQNRYLPTDNIVASAMFMAEKMALYPSLSWDEVYKAYYQG